MTSRATISALNAKLLAADVQLQKAISAKAASDFAYAKLEATSELQRELAVAKAKMQCGGFMLTHCMTGSTSAASAGTTTPGPGPTPQALQFGNFFQ